MLEGVVTVGEGLDHEERLSNDPDFEPDFSQLFDCRGIVKIKITSDAVRLITTKSPFSRKARRAIVADMDLVYGLARMYQMMMRDYEVNVFRDIDEACRWLGIDL